MTIGRLIDAILGQLKGKPFKLQLVAISARAIRFDFATADRAHSECTVNLSDLDNADAAGIVRGIERDIGPTGAARPKAI
jgi:hypothetical protein